MSAPEDPAVGPRAEAVANPMDLGDDCSIEELVEQAVALAEMGFGIVPGPLSGDRQGAGEHPAIGFAGYEIIYDPPQVATKLRDREAGSYGFVPPPGTFVWDVDREAHEQLRALTRMVGRLPETRLHSVGDRRHYLFRWPDGVPGGSGDLLGIATRWSSSSPLVGPGSIDPATGDRCRVDTDAPVAQLPVSWAVNVMDRRDADAHQGDGDGSYGLSGTDPEADHTSATAAREPDPLLARFGVRRLSEVPDSPPVPLLLGRLDPVGHTILFGPGGVGKGVLASSWIAGLVQAGHTVLLLDYEAHESEWRRRVGSLGGPTGLDAVRYVSPLTSGWPGGPAPIWLHAAEIRAVADRVGATFVVIDSIIPACGGVDPMKPETAANYAAALVEIGRPALSLAHVTKGPDSQYPFGSVFFHNLARTSWSLTATAGRTTHRVRLTHRKGNNHANLGVIDLLFEWRDGLPVGVREAGDRLAFKGKRITLADLVAVELNGADDGLTVAEIVASLYDGEEDLEALSNSVRTALRRGRAKEPPQFALGAGGRWHNA